MNTKNSIPHSAACERNQEPILKIIKQYIDGGELLEIGHGTGQHALFFSKHLNVNWWPSDIAQNNWMLDLQKHEIKNLKQSQAIEVGQIPLKQQTSQTFDYIYTANTLHIMSSENANIFCNEVVSLMKTNSLLFIYGPFKFGGQFTSNSNQTFDQSLKSKNPLMGIREFENINNILVQRGMELLENCQMPANNQLLIYKKKKPGFTGP